MFSSGTFSTLGITAETEIFLYNGYQGKGVKLALNQKLIKITASEGEKRLSQVCNLMPCPHFMRGKILQSAFTIHLHYTQKENISETQCWENCFQILLTMLAFGALLKEKTGGTG